MSETVVTGDHRNFQMVDGVLFNREMTRLALCTQKKSENYKIPHTVEIINKGAFTRCKKLALIVISDSITEIQGNAFKHFTRLQSIKISESIERIGYWAFDSCYCLKSVKIPDSVEYIDGRHSIHGFGWNQWGFQEMRKWFVKEFLIGASVWRKPMSQRVWYMRPTRFQKRQRSSPTFIRQNFKDFWFLEMVMNECHPTSRSNYDGRCWMLKINWVLGMMKDIPISKYRLLNT